MVGLIKFLIVVVILYLLISNAIRGALVRYYVRKFTRHVDNDLVVKYINVVSKLRVKNKPQNWIYLRNSFDLVNNADNVDSELKRTLLNILLGKGVGIRNTHIKIGSQEKRRIAEEQERRNEEARKESGKKGEETVQYNLQWISPEYRVLHNARIRHQIDRQEIDSIVVGPKGIFHIETKNYGGKNGCNISINMDGSWIREDKHGVQPVENPSFQLARHDRVLRDFIKPMFQERDIPVVGVIVLANKNTFVNGTQNSRVPVIKAENLVGFIENYDSNETLSHEEINSIYSALQY